MQVPAQGRAHHELSSTTTKSSFVRRRACHFQGIFPLVPCVSTSFLCPSWRRKYHCRAWRAPHSKEGKPLGHDCQAHPHRLAHSELLSQDAASLLVPLHLPSLWWAPPTVLCPPELPWNRDADLGPRGPTASPSLRRARTHSWDFKDITVWFSSSTVLNIWAV